MPFARTSFLRSFRFRVMFAMIVVVVGTMLLTNILVRATLQPSILGEFGRQLADEAEETIADIRALFPGHIPDDWTSTPNFEQLRDLLDRRARSRGNLGKWFIRVYNADKVPVFESEQLAEVPPPLLPDVEHLQESNDYLWVERSWPAQSAPEFWVQTGRSRQALREDFDLLDRTLLVRGIFVIALAPLGGYYLARQVLTPIANIIVTASRLQPQQLSERLPILGTNDELDKVSKTINGMLDRIATYIEKNRAFVANAAHELRSPLAALRSSAEVALNRSRTPEEYANLLTEMIEEVDRLSNMVNRLLLLAESDAGGMIPAPNQTARLDKVVRESADMFQAVAESVGVHIQMETLPDVEIPGEEINLRHAVRNLIDNAVKFSPDGGVVSIRLRVDEEAKQATLEVADQGIGIPSSDLPKLFERFFRGDRSRYRSDGRAGTGLGLSICHAVVTAVGGTIRVASEVRKGTTFTVIFPLARAKA
jgi:two-component system heavy metal sensor histidine kinase CusS